MTDLERILGDTGVPTGQLPLFRRYFELLVERNRVMNLTTITDEASVARLHFLDSLALVPFLCSELENTAAQRNMEPLRLVDVGSGAGFPGLPLAIAMPQMRVTLLDATQKRVDFLCEVADTLGLENVAAVCGRAEEFGAANAKIVSRETIWGAETEVAENVSRETFSIATARAVARLGELCELCLPLVAVGGAFVAMKSVDTNAEIAGAATAIELLGGSVERVQDYEIAGADVRHRLIVVRKNAPTPSRFPRRYAKMQKQPL